MVQKNCIVNVDRLEEVYQEAKLKYNSNCKKFKLPKKPLKSIEDRFEEDKKNLSILRSCFDDIVNSGNYAMLEFNLCNLAVSYVDEENRFDAFNLMKRKRKDYGIEPILITGQVGIVVRTIAKLCRLVNLAGKEGVFESEKDNRMDIFNYAIIGLQLMAGDFR